MTRPESTSVSGFSCRISGPRVGASGRRGRVGIDGGGEAAGEGGGGGGSGISSSRPGFLGLGLANRLRFLTKRSMREVGKPV